MAHNPVRNLVNLGSLNTPSLGPGQIQSRLRHAYFEHGSMYINSPGSTAHGRLESDMRMIHHFLCNPSTRIQEIKEKDVARQRLIIVRLHDNHDALDILVRHAADHEPFSVHSIRFRMQDGTLEFIEEPISPPNKLPHLRYETNFRKGISTFLGAFVDGILQSTTRLGNGLQVASTKSLRQVAESKASSSEVPSQPQHSLSRASDLTQKNDLELEAKRLELKEKELELQIKKRRPGSDSGLLSST
ncbi:hypothetical protein BS50DRAFT_585868 [Corynespora cassiicola Philippines]|uniref:Uncharacterized protein n=1 Tax=Corynespora cassiicola Philippines TaxID=1448308 RepID=A0A2T2NYE6_CORCC|nr:hypothetical protein BS50DRAFT_585868 [Corynespora cassiicola Philippines]